MLVDYRKSLRLRLRDPPYGAILLNELFFFQQYCSPHGKTQLL